MLKTYKLHLCGLQRELPIIPVSNELSIASFVILGDTELVCRAASALVEKLPPTELLLCAEAKGIPLVHEISRLMGMNYIVARKSIKPYMSNPLTEEVFSITTQKKQFLCLDGKDACKIRAKNVTIIDDVISTGSSLQALENLVAKAGGKVTAKGAILAEGDAAKRKDIIFLEKLPLFTNKGDPNAASFQD